ncbi:hypothetical protein [Roseofilum casamattae]|uniref:Uncharacterized protein n=1 Tax=Roseofilum casamattae BLCC-M143 TaxID=3022442 RepID=A0ABT7BWN6_9CYAN|nr:hypothetical protein [Roseofilum casamattae]MDJ1183613.1 hypothetical protein [Roseofilum casamattae BLCC-M143]
MPKRRETSRTICRRRRSPNLDDPSDDSGGKAESSDPGLGERALLATRKTSSDSDRYLSLWID